VSYKCFIANYCSRCECGKQIKLIDFNKHQDGCERHQAQVKSALEKTQIKP
jgi:hypothetical protein